MLVVTAAYELDDADECSTLYTMGHDSTLATRYRLLDVVHQSEQRNAHSWFNDINNRWPKLVFLLIFVTQSEL